MIQQARFYLVLLLTLIFQGLNGQHKNFFDFNQQLSNSLINKVYQDPLDFIWVATEDGLNRFDGIQFTTYTEESHGLKANYITTLTGDSNANMWIGLVNGLLKYNPTKETFEEIKLYIADNRIHPFITGIIEDKNGDIWIGTSGNGIFQIPKGLNHPKYSTNLNNKFCSLFVRALFKDRNEILWIGSDDNGLSSFNPESGEIINYSNKENSDFRIPCNSISSINQDNEGNLYIGSIKDGLFRLNPENKKVTKILPTNASQNHCPVKDLMIDSHGLLWIGTDGSGLYCYNGKTEQLKEYLPSSSSFTFSKSKVHSLMEDRNGNIWIGIFQKGLFLIRETKNIFNHYGYKAFAKNSIGSSCVTSLDGNNTDLWVGTDGDGIYNIQTKTGFTKHVNIGYLTNNVANNNITSLNDTNSDLLWIGTYGNGLIRYNKNNADFIIYNTTNKSPYYIPTDNIGCIIPGEQNKLWIGSLGQGIIHFDPINNKFKTGLNIADSLNNLIPKLINDIYIDHNKNFWIGTYQGLLKSNSDQNSLEIFTSDNLGLPSNIIYCIMSDKKGFIWIGTYKGLVKIDPKTMSLTTFTTEDGMGGNVVCAIEEDENNQLWISTHKGLSRLDPTKNTFVNYYASDGLQSNEFSRNTVYKSQNNQLYFGGINGITEVKKDYNSYQHQAPDVIITHLSKLNKEVRIGDKSGNHTILNRSIIYADTIQLAEIDNVFTIGFTSVDLANQERINYEYMMDGFDSNWKQSNYLNRTATYTNLSHGTYTFNVRSIDKDVRSSIRQLTIIVHPPWYKTLWAKSIWFVLSLILIYIVVQMYKEKFKRIEAERLNEKKMQFFINISHEIRTPLSLILDPLDKLLSQKSNTESMRLYAIMQQNTNRIFRLINQLLDVRKLDKGQMIVKFQETNMVSFIKTITESYQYLAKSKQIELSIESQNDVIEAWIDPLNFEKVIINLLSNAFKFTPTNGLIKIHVNEKVNEKNESIIEIAVTDSGIGISKSDLERIFERFYQVSSENNRNSGGTGIGLHLSRSLVELHKGKLFAQNGPHEIGSTFIIQLLKGNEHLPANDLLTSRSVLPPTITRVENFKSTIDHHTKKPKVQHSYHVMIVEDELEIREYLVNELSKHYKISAYENGQLAHANVLNDKPDLIISDIMMPQMDGITLCKKLKSSLETNHIPIILLTALAKDEDKAEGIETGADMYLVKPFNTNFLKISIKNLLDNRSKLIAKLEKRADKIDIEPIELKSHDEILLQKVMSIIKDNISNSELNVEMLADRVGISRVHMHRKLKELTNLSARDLIKSVRMKQATYILTNKKLNVTEAAYALGYTSLSHFSISFKSYFGVSPKEYVENQKPDF